MTTWTAPVRYAEVDAQAIVFNAHYLTYCDEAMTLFCREHGLGNLGEQVRLVASSLAWTSSARLGETVTVSVSCARVGRTSFVLHFDIGADGRKCCTVETTYVNCAPDGTPTPITARDRDRLGPLS
jgi:acyl-CoA thioester hydrolase